MAKVFIYCLLLASIVVVILSLSTGTYFEGYETTYNALFANEFTSQVDFALFLPNWFGIIPLFSGINTFFQTANGYSICTTIFNILTLWVLLFSIFLICNKRGMGIPAVGIVMLIFVCVYIENLLYIYNLRISFFGIITAFLFLYVIKEYGLPKRYYFLAILLTLLGTTARVEVALLVALILVLFCSIFLNRMLRHSLCLLLFTSSAFLFYKSYQHFFTPRYQALLSVEHVMDDRGGLRYLRASDTRGQEIIKAVTMYIQDDPIYTIENYQSVIGKEGFMEYLSSAHFQPIYLQKLEDLWFLLHPHLGLFGVTIFISASSLLVYWPMAPDRKMFGVQMLAMLLLVSALILILNIVVTVPHNFIVCIAIAVCLLSIVVLVLFAPKVHLGYTLVVLTCILIPFSVSTIRSIYSYQTRLNGKAQAMRGLMENLHKEGKHIIFASNMDETYYPARLFSKLYDHRIMHYYQEFFLSRYPFFERHNREYFGDGYRSMQLKFEKLSHDPQAAYISNRYINKNMADYMWAVHRVRLSFAEIPDEHNTSDVRAYTVSETE